MMHQKLIGNTCEPKAAAYFVSPVILAIRAIVPGFLSSHEKVAPVHCEPDSSYCFFASASHFQVGVKP